MSNLRQTAAGIPLDCTEIITMLGAMQGAADRLRKHELIYEADFLASNFILLDEFFARQLMQWARDDLI